jgi:CRISPR/Cas system-associated exonuclease Cas4 (RecB family)
VQLLPKHPDADLGDLIHNFYQNKIKWAIKDEKSFEKRWYDEIIRINDSYKDNNFQKNYYPISWHSKFFSIKKKLLKNDLLFKKKNVTKFPNVKSEQWLDDGKILGGKLDEILINNIGDIIEIIDYKTGGIFEFVDKKKVIKQSYQFQLILYAMIVKQKQNSYPKCFIKDLNGNKFEIKFNEELAAKTYKAATELFNTINDSIEKNDLKNLANPDFENCKMCNYRPICDVYNDTYLNNFESKNVDIRGEIVDIKIATKSILTIIVNEKIYKINNVTMNDSLKIGDNVTLYNLYCPDGSFLQLFALKNTIIKHG